MPDNPVVQASRALSDAALFAGLQLRARPLRSLTLSLGLAVALALPAFSALGVRRVADRLSARAEGVPLLVVPRGEAVDGALAALYFRPGAPPTVPFGLLAELRAGDGGPGLVAAPLHLGHSADGAPIVGTGLAYFEQRGLRVAQGRGPALLGEVVVGAAVAAERGIAPGDQVRSDLRDLYDLGGAYPLSLPVVGVFEYAGNADDYAIFTDVKTCWALDGHLHGHAPPAEDDGPPAGQAEAPVAEGAAASFLIQSIDAQSRARFHLHGDAADLPISSLMLFPADVRARDLLLAALDGRPAVEVVEPGRLVASLLGVLRQVEVAVRLGLLSVGAAALAFFGVSLQLALAARADELRLLRRLGASRRRVALILGVELGMIACCAILTAVLALLGGLWALDRALLG